MNQIESIELTEAPNQNPERIARDRIDVRLRAASWQVQHNDAIDYAQGVKANVIFLYNRAADPDPQTSKVWYYDYRTNVHHTLKQKPLTYGHLEDFVACYNGDNLQEREPTWGDATPDGRWRAYDREELLAHDKASLDIFWLRDASMTDLDNLPEPDTLASEIVENLQSALAQFAAVANSLEGRSDR